MSVADRPPLKRKRPETAEDESFVPASDPVRSDIWYEDGNVILQAENIQFRVHRGILAQCSTVFRDMFSFPQPPSSDVEMVEGCAVVHLSDTAEEVGYILKALCPQRCVITSLLHAWMQGSLLNNR